MMHQQFAISCDIHVHKQCTSDNKLNRQAVRACAYMQPSSINYGYCNSNCNCIRCYYRSICNAYYSGGGGGWEDEWKGDMNYMSQYKVRLLCIFTTELLAEA